MVKVKIWGSLKNFADGNDYISVSGSNFKQVLDDISLKYPGLKPQINRSVSLAINGKIYRESWFIPIDDDSEVVLMPYMQVLMKIFIFYKLFF